MVGVFSTREQIAILQDRNLVARLYSVKILNFERNQVRTLNIQAKFQEIALFIHQHVEMMVFSLQLSPTSDESAWINCSLHFTWRLKVPFRQLADSVFVVFLLVHDVLALYHKNPARSHWLAGNWN